ncbi:MAG: hypothetical protein ACRDWI_14525 [Jiangellaceae bacterium]
MAERDESLDTGSDGRTELRVHGVSGTSAETILAHPLLKRVAGDERAAFYRRWYPGGRSADLGRHGRLEAYSWGGLTSGPAARGAWLLLLPLMLINLAHWMLPAVPAGASRRQVVAGHAAAVLLRLMGLVLTVTFLLTAVLIAVDLAGWQCGRIARCATSTPLLGLLADGFLSSAGRRIAVSAVVPLLVVLLVGMVGRRTPRTTEPAPDATVPQADKLPLAGRHFWRGNPGMLMLRTSHVAAATALLAGLVAWPATNLVATGAAQVLGAAVCLGALAILAYAVVLVAAEAVTGRGASAALEQRTPWLIAARGATYARRTALVLLAISMVYSAWGWDWVGAQRDVGRLPGLRAAILISFAIGVAVLLLLAIAVVVQRPWAQGDRTDPGSQVAVRGLGGPAVATVAFIVAGGFSAGITYRIAELMGYPVISSSTAAADLERDRLIAADPSQPFELRVAAATDEIPMIVPPSFAWAGAATTTIAVSLVVIGIVVVLGVRSRLGTLADEVLRARPDEAVGRSPADPDVRRVASAVGWASLTDGVGRIVGRVVLVSGAVLLGRLVVYAAGENNWRFVEEPPLSTVTAFGTWIMGLFALGLVVLAWQSARSPALRRTVGILWDIGSFWPRAAHPLAPPSYGERAVPQLAARVTELAGSPSARVVLSGHSQGSILVAAAVLHLEPETAQRVELLTHGSPLRRLYARFFPAYLGQDALLAARDRVDGRWRNLYRDTDPIGAWALDPATAPDPPVDRHLVDPPTLADEIAGHSDYWSDPGYARALVDLSGSHPSRDQK